MVYTGGSLITTYEEQEEFPYEEQEYTSQRRCYDMMVKAYDSDQSCPRPYVKECGQTLQAEIDKEIDFTLEFLERTLAS